MRWTWSTACAWPASRSSTRTPPTATNSASATSSTPRARPSRSSRRTPSSASPTTTSPIASPCSAATRPPSSRWPGRSAASTSGRCRCRVCFISMNPLYKIPHRRSHRPPMPAPSRRWSSSWPSCARHAA